ncbi:CRTC1 [Mytilus coruscus]|uniref:CRTC1 n=1 Tax=Mytilus coruscus TaxID=42192 RepID=A0A6J8DXK7_MYTCO|nr:CRTC1 [Mytilus coruscus]
MEINKSEFNAIRPGLFKMKLKLMYTSNQARVENRKIALHNAKENEHQIVHDVVEKGNCVLEQGYVELFEEYTEDGIETQQRLSESLQLINVEQSTAVGRTKDFLCQASNNAMDARRLLFQALSCKSTDSLVDKKNFSVERFQKGVQYHEITSYPKEQYHIWKFYYAMACSKMPVIKDADYNKTSMSKKAVELFWSVIVNLPKENECFTIYRARSYAYIGYILISKSYANPKYSY